MNQVTHLILRASSNFKFFFLVPDNDLMVFLIPDILMFKKYAKELKA